MRRILLIVAGFFFVSAATLGQERGFGIGIILGEPTGLSAKGWVSQENAFDAGLAWSFRHEGFFHIHGDYLWHFPNVIRSSEKFLVYTGIGGRLGARKHDAIFGIRVVGGIAFVPRGAPIDIFVELAPVLNLAPATDLSGNGGIGVRFFLR